MCLLYHVSSESDDIEYGFWGKEDTFSKAVNRKTL